MEWQGGEPTEPGYYWWTYPTGIRKVEMGRFYLGKWYVGATTTGVFHSSMGRVVWQGPLTPPDPPMDPLTPATPEE